MSKKHTPLLIIGFIIIAAAVVFGSVKLSAVLSDKTVPSASPEAAGHEHAHEEEGSPAPAAPEVDLTSQSKVAMDIANYAYSQPNIKIKAGTTVTWTNQDPIRHNVMREHQGSEHAHAAPAKSEVKPDVFAGSLLAKGESYSFTFKAAGTYPYHCAPHPFMTGTVTVVGD